MATKTQPAGQSPSQARDPEVIEIGGIRSPKKGLIVLVYQKDPDTGETRADRLDDLDRASRNQVYEEAFDPTGILP